MEVVLIHALRDLLPVPCNTSKCSARVQIVPYTVARYDKTTPSTAVPSTTLPYQHVRIRSVYSIQSNAWAAHQSAATLTLDDQKSRLMRAVLAVSSNSETGKVRRTTSSMIMVQQRVYICINLRFTQSSMCCCPTTSIEVGKQYIPSLWLLNRPRLRVQSRSS